MKLRPTKNKAHCNTPYSNRWVPLTIVYIENNWTLKENCINWKYYYLV